MINPMSTPTSRPTITAKAALKLPKNIRLRIRAQTTTNAVALYSPVFNALCGSPFLPVFMIRAPTTEARMPAADNRSGNRTPAV